MYGASGRKAYTFSVLNILKSANMTSSVRSSNTLLQSKSKAQMFPIPNKLKFNMVKDNAYIMY